MESHPNPVNGTLTRSESHQSSIQAVPFTVGRVVPGFNLTNNEVAMLAALAAETILTGMRMPHVRSPEQRPLGDV